MNEWQFVYVKYNELASGMAALSAKRWALVISQQNYFLYQSHK